MNGLIFAFVAPFVLGLFTASVNVGVWHHRRSEKGHRALAMVGAAGLVLLASVGVMYASDSRAEAIAAHSVLLLGSIPIQLGNIRLAERIYGQRLRAHYVFGAGLTLLWVLIGWIPGALYGDGTVVRGTGLGIDYVDVELTALGKLAPLTLLPGFVALSLRIRRAASRDEDRSLVVATMAGSAATAGIDLFTMGGWIDAPYLYGLAFTLASVVYTSLLLRRFVDALGRVEASTDLLQLAAESRAHELRETDLRLAHGARLAALGTLAAGLAHEINNPVAFIRSNLNYMHDLAAEGRDDPEIEDVLKETEEGVARLRGIVDELLRMSAQGAAGFGEVHLSEVVESALPTLRFEARSDVALDARLAPIPPVRGDRNLLGQVVANLVINAIQAVRLGGARGAVRIATFADDRRAVLEVSDTGPGVAPELAERIFEPFFTTKPAGEGTGLGLAVSRQLVERHGGRLTLVPSEHGARFRVELPLASASAFGPPRPREAAAPTAR
ncbi:MAG TPA: HAMP domain-containing sensor histidine kinase [Myxococcota bacterium]